MSNEEVIKVYPTSPLPIRQPSDADGDLVIYGIRVRDMSAGALGLCGREPEHMKAEFNEENSEVEFDSSGLPK